MRRNQITKVKKYQGMVKRDQVLKNGKKRKIGKIEKKTKEGMKGK